MASIDTINFNITLPTMSSDEFKRLLPNLTSWLGHGYDLTQQQRWALAVKLCQIKLHDCLDVVPVPGGGHIFLADSVSATNFMIANPDTVHLDMSDGVPWDIFYVKKDESHALFDMIENALISGQNVLISCLDSVFRSPSLVIAFLIHIESKRDLSVSTPTQHIENLKAIRWSTNGSRQRIEINDSLQSLLFAKKTGVKLTQRKLSNFSVTFFDHDIFPWTRHYDSDEATSRMNMINLLLEDPECPYHKLDTPEPSSSLFKSVFPDIRSWIDIERSGMPCDWMLDFISLKDCVDKIPVPGGGLIFLGDVDGSDKFMESHPQALRIDLHNNGPYKIRDCSEEDILRMWARTNTFQDIDHSLTTGRDVMVNCQAGISRSTSTVIGYLMWRESQLGLEVHTPEEHVARLTAIRWSSEGSRQHVAPKFMNALNRLHNKLTQGQEVFEAWWTNNALD